MAKSKSFLESKTFKSIMAKIYGLGAAVVILGALFKLQHYEGAGIMLIVGLGTEAAIFALSAFEPVKEDYDWTLVYPELAGIEEGKKKDKKKSASQELDKAFEDAQIDQNLIQRLGDGMRSLSDNVNKMGQLTDAAVATDEYTSKVKEAAQNVDKINQSYSENIQALQTLNQSSEVTKEYFDQVKEASQKLSSLNSVYEMELEETNNHIKSLNKYYDSLTKTIENLSGSQEETSKLKDEFGRLNNNLASLNSVYGNMLSAMGTSSANNANS
jgi:gliding motility-associated protein GldL